MRLIDADKFTERCKQIISEESNNPACISWAFAYDNVIDEINEQPTIERRKKGKWIEYIPEHGKCPFCGNQVDLLNGKANNFCGECGTDMRTETNETN